MKEQEWRAHLTPAERREIEAYEAAMIASKKAHPQREAIRRRCQARLHRARKANSEIVKVGR